MKEIVAFTGTYSFGVIIGILAGRLDTIFIALLTTALFLVWAPVYLWLISDSDPK